jgi:hypothetical protein
MSLPFKELPDSALNALIERERTRVVAPLTEWRTLSLQLRDEGLLHSPSASSSARQTTDRTADGFGSMPPRRRTSPLRWGARMVASVALLGGGVLIGRGWSIGNQIVPVIQEAIQTDSVPARGESFNSVHQAKRVLMRAQDDYQRAAAYLAASSPLEDSADLAPGAVPPAQLMIPSLRDRLAALDAVTAAAHKAVREAPQDPLVNLYYMSTMNARAATLHRLDRSLPEGVRLTGY